MPFTAYATSPTVTMPRIKAITTGSTPSFLDVVLNIDEGDKSSSLSSQDSWLAQMKAKGSGKLVLYGDDTWLKLFPDTFDRADGTSSFFVAVCRRQMAFSLSLSMLMEQSRTLPRWTITSPAMSQASSRTTTGASWCSTILVWIISVTREVQGGKR